MNGARKEIPVGLIGFGTVGQGVWKHLEARGSELAEDVGLPLRIAAVAVRDRSRKRETAIPSGLLTEDPMAVVGNPEIPVICELAGGTTEALDWTRAALAAGKTVVTANKALLCEHGEELMEAAAVGGARLFFEASVAGGIPVIKTLREGLVGNRFDRIFGILNGTSNFILTKMESDGAGFEQVLGEARRLGYVEADESLDLDGWDAAHKVVVLAWLAHRLWVPTGEMIVEGIRGVSLADMRFARELGHRIKLIGSIVHAGGEGRVSLSVRPTLVPLTSLMADVDDAYNAVRLEGDLTGPTVLIGRGAGQDPTASAVVSDLVDAGRALVAGSHPRSRSRRAGDAVGVAGLESVIQEYYIRLTVADRPGVLAEVAGAFSRRGISIATVIQRYHGEEGTASLVLVTHECSEKDLRAALDGVTGGESVLGNILVCPILDPE